MYSKYVKMPRTPTRNELILLFTTKMEEKIESQPYKMERAMEHLTIELLPSFSNI